MRRLISLIMTVLLAVLNLSWAGPVPAKEQPVPLSKQADALSGPAASRASVTSPKEPAYVPGRIIVILKDSADTDPAWQEGAVDKNVISNKVKKGTASVTERRMHRFGVRNTRSLYMTEEDTRRIKRERGFVDKEGKKKLFRAKNEEFKRKFPERFNRGNAQANNFASTALSSEVKEDASYNTYVVEVDPNVDINQAVKEFKADPNVESVQPDYQMGLDALDPPADPYYAASQVDYLWPLHKTGAVEAWDKNKGRTRGIKNKKVF